jgi:hypothetical protein
MNTERLPMLSDDTGVAAKQAQEKRVTGRSL